MDRLSGLKCRECGRAYPEAPVHVCELCFRPLEVDYRVLRPVRPRTIAKSLAIGNPADGYDALQDRLRPHVNIRPSLSAFDRALANLKAGAQEVR